VRADELRGGRNVRFPPIVDLRGERQMVWMGKRSGVPRRDEELEQLTPDELQAELERSRGRLAIAGSPKVAKEWHKRIH
jgi:hypothetical protein